MIEIFNIIHYKYNFIKTVKNNLFCAIHILKSSVDKAWAKRIGKSKSYLGLFSNHKGTTSQKWCWPVSYAFYSLWRCLHFAEDVYILACIERVWIKLSSSWDGNVARGCLHDSKSHREELRCQTCDMVSRWNTLNFISSREHISLLIQVSC